MAGALTGARILVLPRYDPSGASSRVRLFAYGEWLAAAGAQVTYRPFNDAGYIARLYGGGGRDLGNVAAAYHRRLRDLRTTGDYDLVWVEKEVFPFLPAPAERLLSRAGVPYVLDYDDAVFHKYDRNPHRLVRATLASKLDGLLAGSAAVTAGSRYLEDYARAHGAKRVEGVPSVVELDRYPLRPPPVGDRLRVGWIGSPSTTPHLAAVLPALEAAARHHPVTLVTVGATALTSEEPQLVLEQHEWSAQTEGDRLADIHLGIMPLPDEPFERGKCGFKLIQCMAAGRPVIASPVGANRDIVTTHVGVLADTAAEWEAAVLAMAADPGRRVTMGEAARRRVEERYCYAVTAPKVVELFQHILASA